MFSLPAITKALLCLGAILPPASAVLPLTIKGDRFIRPSLDSDEGTVFFINGVDYQPGGSSDYTYNMTSDILTDPQVCARDATLIQNLGANTIRIYTIDPDLNHDECMSIFNDAGIYVILDVNSPLGGESLNRDDPESTYNAWYMSRVFKVIESFRTYSNVIGFFIGNEVINDASSASLDPAYLRAVTRDAKSYISNRLKADSNAREVYVGYSAADEVDLRMSTYEYLTCSLSGNDSSIDFFGLNTYEWCSGVNDWQSSGYLELESDFANSSVPLFFSEYGCNKKSPRTFDEVSEGLYGGLIDVFDGGLVYEYSTEAADYGLVDISSDNEVVLLADYFNFKDQLAKSKIPTINETKVSTFERKKCTSSLIQGFDKSFASNFTLPKANKDTEWMIDNGVSVNHQGKFVDVDKYLSVYASGGSAAGNLTKADFVVSTNSASSTTSLYLTVEKSNLVNSKSTSESSSSSSSSSSSVPATTSSSSSSSSALSSSSATVSTISSTSSHKNEVHKIEAHAWGQVLWEF